MIKYFTLTFLTIVIPILASAQSVVPRIDWYKIYDGPGNGVDLTNDIKMDRSNNIYLAGRSAGADASQDLLLLKYSPAGSPLLELRYISAPHSWDEAFSVAVDSELNIYIIGDASFGQSSPYAVFHKYSSTGELLWAKDFNDDIDINSQGDLVTLNSKGDAIISYRRASTNIAKYTDSGDSLWTISFRDDTSYYQVNCFITDRKDNIYGAISQIYFDGGDVANSKLIIIKINDSGEIFWEKRSNFRSAKKILLDKTENVILLADDNRIIKFDPEGDTLWTRDYPYINDIAITTDMIIDSNNDIVFTGYGPGDDSWDYYTQKLSAAGEDLWQSIFSGDEHLNDFAYSVALDKENNIYVTGTTHNSISVGTCYTLKYSSSGELKWKFKFDAPHSQFENGNRIFVDDSNNVYVGGDVADSTNGWNFLALKIRQDKSNGINSNNTIAPIDYVLSQNYPNPFNPSTMISFSLPSEQLVSLKVFDLLGKEIVTLVSGKLLGGNHSYQWNAEGLPSGIYFYRLQACTFSDTKKLILLR